MTKWLDRTLITNPIYYALCLSEKSFHKELKRMKVPKDTWPSFLKSTHANATVHFFENGNKISAILCLGSTKEVDLIQVHSLLVHECVHLWQRIKLYIGEDEPSKEFEAYSIQAMAQNYMYAYKKMKGKK